MDFQEAQDVFHQGAIARTDDNPYLDQFRSWMWRIGASSALTQYQKSELKRSVRQLSDSNQRLSAENSDLMQQVKYLQGKLAQIKEIC